MLVFHNYWFTTHILYFFFTLKKLGSVVQTPTQVVPVSIFALWAFHSLPQSDIDPDTRGRGLTWHQYIKISGESKYSRFCCQSIHKIVCSSLRHRRRWVNESEVDDESNFVVDQLRVAALNKPYSGDSHGIRGADYECHRQAKKANLKGSFRAFLSGRDQNLESIVKSKDAHLPLVNSKGEILFNAWKEIFSGSGAPFAVPPRIYSFDGRNVLTDSTWWAFFTTHYCFFLTFIATRNQKAPQISMAWSW